MVGIAVGPDGPALVAAGTTGTAAVDDKAAAGTGTTFGDSSGTSVHPAASRIAAPSMARLL
ncbi:hypothetical protein [Kitasatospora herbaricolor]|uniref:hypothetical protein n=1 Tax=Kitasatospora herbaricolor TaxID=68217 RepID=UPI00174BFC91|nr:hypothetical protein [Kitasatospora herbaricolor]